MSDEQNSSQSGLQEEVEVEGANASESGSAEANDRVGYKRPPKHSRFQPGQSGNPRGRPPGVKSLSDIVRKIVGQKVTITENGRTRRVPRLEAILLRAAGEASRGDAPALRLLLQLTERYGEARRVAPTATTRRPRTSRSCAATCPISTPPRCWRLIPRPPTSMEAKRDRRR